MKKIFFPNYFHNFFISEAKKAGKIHIKIFLNAILMILKLETISSMPKKSDRKKLLISNFSCYTKKAKK